jgi:two-component system chemotaxis response regulator CheY
MQTSDSNALIFLDEIEIPKGISFLIVEDEGDICDLIKDNLIEFGFEGAITISNSAEHALELCQKSIEEKGILKPFDFIISDWNLEGLSGLDFLIEIKKIPLYEETPFLMITANDNVSGMLVATKKGASEYLVKPWEENELATKLALSWDKHKS